MLRGLRALRLLTLLTELNRRATNSLRGRVIFYVVGATVLVVFCASLAMLDAERNDVEPNIGSFPDALGGC